MATKSDLNALFALYAQLDAEPEPPQERRLHPRTAAKGHVPATLELPPGAPPISVTIRDMSRSGIGLFAPRPLPVGATALVTFRLKAGPVRATCRVANCREDDAGYHIVGLALTDVHKPLQHPAPTTPAAPPSPPMPTTTPNELGGTVLSANDVMAGAELTAVNEVVQRLARVIAQS